MQSQPHASSSTASSFQGYPAAQWIHSANDFDHHAPSTHDTATSNGWGHAQKTRWEETEVGASYGPTLRRKGNLTFIKAKGEGGSSGIGKGKTKENAYDWAGLYEGIHVTSKFAPPRPRQTMFRSATRLSDSTLPRPMPDVDLTLDDDSSDEVVMQEEKEEEKEEEDDDDVIFIDPITSLPLPRLRRLAPPSPPLPRINRRRLARPLAIHEMIPNVDVVTGLDQVLIPPIQYGIKENNIGWKLLKRQGWKEGTGLGMGSSTVAVKQEGKGSNSKSLPAPVGLLVPLKSSDKMDRRGLGMKVVAKWSEGTKHARSSGGSSSSKIAGERPKKRGKRERRVEREKAEMAHKTVWERRDMQERSDRKQMLRYMNH